mmetsp:Transcript_8739/g.29765  ORF Transcript_8739/g.29765 Transcript_8739/m.29765 type:complete len:204 (-) Transcript_8739:132-743(-)
MLSSSCAARATASTPCSSSGGRTPPSTQRHPVSALRGARGPELLHARTLRQLVVRGLPHDSFKNLPEFCEGARAGRRVRAGERGHAISVALHLRHRGRRARLGRGLRVGQRRLRVRLGRLRVHLEELRPQIHGSGRLDLDAVILVLPEFAHDFGEARVLDVLQLEAVLPEGGHEVRQARVPLVRVLLQLVHELLGDGCHRGAL